jgi:hypothetical protein
MKSPLYENAAEYTLLKHGAECIIIVQSMSVFIGAMWSAAKIVKRRLLRREDSLVFARIPCFASAGLQEALYVFNRKFV